MTSRTISDEKQVEELEHQLHEAFLQRDTETVDRILADDFTFIDPEGRHATKAEWMTDMKSGGVIYESIHQDELQVRVYEDAAVTIGRVTMNGRSADEGAFHGQYCYTCMYVKREGRWQAVAEQANLISQE